jgi:hypothetical protein
MKRVDWTRIPQGGTDKHGSGLSLFIRVYLCPILLAVCLLLAASAGAQSSIDPRAFVRIALPADSPLELLNVEYGSTRITRQERGMKMDLDLVLHLRNRSERTIEALAVTLGYGFVKSEGLDAVSGVRLEPGQIYALPARMQADIELPPARSRARPVDLPTAVNIGLDAVLFSDGSSYGPDRMRSLGTLRINQAESARDRRFFLALFQSGGLPRVVPVLDRWVSEGDRIPGAQRLLAGEAAEAARSSAEPAEFRAVRLSGAPLEILSARARLHRGRLVDPALEVRNSSGSPMADFEVNWVLHDSSGTEFRAVTVSGSARPGRRSDSSGLPLAANQTLSWSAPSVIEAAPGGIELLPGRVYVRAVQFVDGRVWVPDRVALESASLSRISPVSPETYRLFGLYRSRGSAGLLGDLRR